MSKKITALLLVFCMLIGLTACGKEKKTATTTKTKSPNKKVDTSFKEGTPSSWGDVYDLPEIKGGAQGAPIIGQVSATALPDDSVTLVGQNFSSDKLKVYVYSQSTKDNGKVAEAKTHVSEDGILTATIDKSLEYGIYAIYAENSKGKSNVKFINAPEIWYLSFTTADKGDIISVYGANLTADKKDEARLFLLSDDNKYCEPEITYADNYKISFKVPEGLEYGKSYTVKIHSGHGGELGFCEAKEKFTCAKNERMSYTGKTVDVTDFGADPKDVTNDDTEALQKAFNNVENGDTVYFPAGVYFVSSSIMVSRAVRIMGASKKNSIILCGNALERYALNISTPGVEICDLGFQHKRNAGQLTSGFINYSIGNTTSGEKQGHIHDCDFVQEVSVRSKSKYYTVCIAESSGVILEDNTFYVPSFLRMRYANRIIIQNNKVVSNLYVGSYYGQNSTHMHGLDMCDFNNNDIHGADLLDDPDVNFKTNDMTAGRGLVFQGYAERIYIAHNKFRATGTPGSNAGEIILFEQRTIKFDGTAVANDKKTITFDNNYKLAERDVVSIVSGRGKGQIRLVESIYQNTVTLRDELDVLPEPDSKIIVSHTFTDIAVDSNYFHGYENYSEISSSTTSAGGYGNMFNTFYTNNENYQVCCPVSLSMFYRNEKELDPKAIVYWCYFDGNTYEDCAAGVAVFVHNMSGSGTPRAETILGVTVRRSKFKDMKGYVDGGGGMCGAGGMAIFVGSKSEFWNGPVCNSLIIENNTFENSATYDIEIGSSQGNTILRNNKNVKGEVTISVQNGAKEPIKLK